MTIKNQGVKPFAIAAIAIFGLVSVAHLLRLVLGWSVMINGINVPMWISVIGFVVPGGLACMLWRESRR